MMLAISVGSILITTMSVYLTTKIEDEVFKVGMGVVALVFALITLICAPWILKLFVIVLPLFLGNVNDLSIYN